MAIVEDDHHDVIKTALSGVKQKAIKVGGPADALPFSGARKDDTEAKDNIFHRGKQAYGRFARRAPLPKDFDDEKVAAAFKDGRRHRPSANNRPRHPQAP